MSEQTFYRWKKQYAGMQAEGMRELKTLQEDNARLNKLAAPRQARMQPHRVNGVRSLSGLLGGFIDSRGWASVMNGAPTFARPFSHLPAHPSVGGRSRGV